MIRKGLPDFYGAADFSKRSVEVINEAIRRCPKSINGLLINGYYYKNVSSYRSNVLDILKQHNLRIIIDPGTYSVWRKNQGKPFITFLPQLIENLVWTFFHLREENFSDSIFGVLLPDHHMDPKDTVHLASKSFSILVKKHGIPKNTLIGICHGSLPDIPTSKFIEDYVTQHLEGIVNCYLFYIKNLGLSKVGLGACSAFKIKANPLNLFQRRAETLYKRVETSKSTVHIHALGVGTKDLLNNIRNFIDSFDTQTYLTNTRVRKLPGQARTEAAINYLLDLRSPPC